MVRIHFTAADLARTHIASEPDPLWELVLSLHVLQREYRQHSYPEWRATLPRGEHRARFDQLVRTMLVPVTPAGPYFPDFLTPIEGLAGLEEGLDAVLRTPDRQVRQELEMVTPPRGSQGWVAAVADGRAESRSLLTQAMRAYFQQALAPYWPTIRARVRTEFMVRSRLYGDGGITGLLASLRPVFRWEPPVLVIDGPSSRDIHLNGRGLTIIPSYFNCHNPITLTNLDLPPIVTYPAARLGGLLNRAEPVPDQALADLLGSTRAAALRAAVAGCTTTDLAKQIGVSPSTASEHATVLRRAGLITTERYGLVVWHAITPLGAALLSARPDAQRN